MPKHRLPSLAWKISLLVVGSFCWPLSPRGGFILGTYRHLRFDPWRCFHWKAYLRDASQDYFADGMTDELIPRSGADPCVARNFAYVGDAVQTRAQVPAPDREGAER